MSAKYTYLAWEQEGIKGTQLLVLLQLANNANDDGLSWYSVEKMAIRCKIGIRTFRENLKILEERGLVAITRRQNKTSIYQLNLGVRNPQGAESAGQGCEIRRSRGAKSADDPNKEPNNDPDTNKNTKANRSLDFTSLKFSAEEVEEFKTLRNKAKAPITQRVIDNHAKEFAKSRQNGMNNDHILNIWSDKGWKAYKYEWAKNSIRITPPQQGYAYAQRQQTEIHRGIEYGEFADQSIFPEELQLATNEIPAVKESVIAMRRTYIEQHYDEILAKNGGTVRKDVGNDEWQGSE